MHKDIENKIGNLEAQRKQVKLEIAEIEELKSMMSTVDNPQK